jgi:hypothetical protein
VTRFKAGAGHLIGHQVVGLKPHVMERQRPQKSDIGGFAVFKSLGSGQLIKCDCIELRGGEVLSPSPSALQKYIYSLPRITSGVHCKALLQ